VIGRNLRALDYAVDVLDFDVSKVPFVPDVIWASPPCTTFSVASIGRYWNKDRTPKHEKAELGMQLADQNHINHQALQGYQP
jgi:site-specific DNA-cytosine methylase